MLRRVLILFSLVVALAAAPVLAQTSVTFQNGTTMLMGGAFYEGTVDTEFRSDSALGPLGDEEEISVDNNNGGNQSTAAIRFENLLFSEGGLIPDGLAREDILFAELRLWITSNSDSDAMITYSRVVGPDTTSGDVWQEDDTWVSLGGDLFANEGGFLDCQIEGLSDMCPIRRDDVEASSVPDFVDAMPGLESADILSDLISSGTPVADAIDQAFFRYDATDAVRDWLADGEPNYGWAVHNNTGNGWDFVTSELVTEFESEWSEAGLGPEHFRPALTIVFASGPILDLDGDTDVDEDDFAAFLNRLGVEIDGPIPTGALGDFDFDRDVDLEDFKFFKANFEEQNMMFPPMGSGSLSGGAIPEPSSCVLAGLALAWLGVGARRRPAAWNVRRERPLST